MRIRQSLASMLKVLVSALLLYLVFRSVDLSKIRHDLANLSATHLVTLLLVCWLGQMLCAQRWRLFAASLGMPGNYRSFFQMYFVGMLFNVGMPSLVGGDLIKAYMVSRKSRSPLRSGLASVLQERAAGLISLLAYGTVAAVVWPLRWRNIPLWIAYGVVWIGVVAVVWVAWRGESFYRRLLGGRPASLLAKILTLLADFHQALATMRLTSGAVFQVVALSFVNSALVLWLFRGVSVAAGHPAPLVAFSALFPLIVLLTMLPITIGGLGIREWAYVEALALLGIPHDNALLIALITSTFLIVNNLAGVLFLPTIPSDLRFKTDTRGNPLS